MTEGLPRPSLTGRFAAIIRGLRSDFCQRGNQIRLPAWLVKIIYARLTRTIDLFAAIVAKDRANPTLKPPAPARIGPPRPTPDSAPARPPHQFAWLIRLVPPNLTQGNAASNGRIHIQSLLSDPELQSLIARNPAAGGIFRTLCHMLVIPTPPILRRPKQPRSPRPEPQPARLPKPRATPLTLPHLTRNPGTARPAPRLTPPPHPPQIRLLVSAQSGRRSIGIDAPVTAFLMAV